MKSYKVKLNIDWVLNWTPKKMAENYGLLEREDGTPLTGGQILNEAIKAKNKGYQVFPVCENCGSDGHCSGHEKSIGGDK